MITIEQKHTLQDILRLDSVYDLLSYSERINVRGKMLDWHWATLSPGVRNLIDHLDRYGVVIPVLRIGHDRLTYVSDEITGELLSVEDYNSKNKAVKNLLKSIYNESEH